MSEYSMRLLRRFWRTKVGPIFAGTLLLMGLACILAPLLAPFDPVHQHLRETLQPPGGKFLLGTDELGRDLFSRLLHGGRVTLTVCFLSIGGAALVGVPLGMFSGLLGGRIDTWIMHAVNALLAFPSLLLAFSVSAIIGPSIAVVIIAIGVVFAPRFARFARGQTLIVRELPYVEAARASGASIGRILWRHLLPNIAAPMLVEVSLAIGYAVLVESSISFLGAGIQPPRSSWGLMIKQGFGYMEAAPWIALVPGLAILVLTLAANMLGDAIRDTLDPRVRL